MPLAIGWHCARTTGCPRVSPNPAEAGRDAEANIILSSPSYALKAFAVNAGHGLGENAQFYANATASDRTAQAIQNFRLPATIFTTYKAPGC